MTKPKFKNTSYLHQICHDVSNGGDEENSTNYRADGQQVLARYVLAKHVRSSSDAVRNAPHNSQRIFVHQFLRPFFQSVEIISTFNQVSKCIRCVFFNENLAHTFSLKLIVCSGSGIKRQIFFYIISYFVPSRSYFVKRTPS